uniref:WDR36/Utp21 N-terminal domain-containing protein n=1 Tax=Strigamia maritima TaxID=126957 RepID=T1J751_STRMM
MSGSRIFCGYKNLGSVSNHIPLQTRYIERRGENLVVTTVGKVFNTYGCSKLRLLSVSESHPCDISCTAADKYLIYTGCQNVIRSWKRGCELINTYEDDSDVRLLLPFGPFLISINENNNVKKWNIETKEMELELMIDRNNFEITAIMHPNTYLDEILLGSKQGKMQLWNIETSHLSRSFDGWDSEITTITQSTAIDVVGVGLASGEIIIHNLEHDKTLMKFKQEWGSVTAISFRLDGQPIMATGSPIGHIAVWNLEKKKLVSQIRDAHSTYVTGMQFLPDEPLLITSSPDNSLKIWIFDQSADGARILKLREGHSAPPTFIRFYGDNADDILSAGQDSTLKSFSTINDLLHKNFGTASLHPKSYKKHHYEHLKMPSIVCFDAEPTREREWDNVVACHRGYCTTSIWSTHKRKLGSHYLRHERFKIDLKVVAKCVTLTSCGNFAVIGYDSGHVDVFNLQSGIWRGAYGTPKAHKWAVTGVAVDGTNHTTFTGGIDQRLKYWKFKSKELIESVQLDAAVSKLILKRENGLLACILDNFSIFIFDTDTRKAARVFKGHTNRITDACFSADSRWLISSSMDSTIRTWDLKNSALIDCFSVTSPCISLSISSKDNTLATCHIDELSIYLWKKKLRIGVLAPLPEDFQPVTLDLPSAATCVTDEEEMVVDQTETETKDEADLTSSTEESKSDLIKTINMPDSFWLRMLKKKSHLKAPAAKPKLAPFFLPSITNEFKFVRH